jgi:phosphoribosylglycinamide formyltransferase-1
VQAGDDLVSVTDRVLALEHVMYPRAVRWFVEDQLRIEDGLVQQLGGECQAFS